MGEAVLPRQRVYGGPMALRDGAIKSLLVIAHIGWTPRVKPGGSATQDEVAPNGRRSDSV